MPSDIHIDNGQSCPMTFHIGDLNLKWYKQIHREWHSISFSTFELRIGNKWRRFEWLLISNVVICFFKYIDHQNSLVQSLVSWQNIAIARRQLVTIPTLAWLGDQKVRVTTTVSPFYCVGNICYQMLTSLNRLPLSLFVIIEPNHTLLLAKRCPRLTRVDFASVFRGATLLQAIWLHTAGQILAAIWFTRRELVGGEVILQWHSLALVLLHSSETRSKRQLGCYINFIAWPSSRVSSYRVHFVQEGDKSYLPSNATNRHTHVYNIHPSLLHPPLFYKDIFGVDCLYKSRTIRVEGMFCFLFFCHGGVSIYIPRQSKLDGLSYAGEKSHKS